jgi:hypothetical protein
LPGTWPRNLGVRAALSKEIRGNPGKMPLDNSKKAAGFTLGGPDLPIF